MPTVRFTRLLGVPERSYRRWQQRETDGWHAGLEADHLEVLVGPDRCSALRFQTRSSTCASPSAAFSSSFSSASARSRWLGSSLPLSARPYLPPSRNCRFQVEIDCSLALPRRAASAVVISPLMTARTSLNLSSTEKTEGRATCSSLHKEPDTNPHARFRDAGHPPPRPTSPAASPKARAAATPPASSSATSPATSTGYCNRSR